MIVSEARISANRRNAQKSTGPRTEEGKSRSRANALKHGLCASAVVPESLELIAQRSREFFDTLKPQNEVHVWMVNQAALASIRVERCQRIERRIRDKISLRAELTWDDDRRFEAEVIGRSLAKDPAATVEALQRTPHGCEWLMTRWAMLAYSADTQPGGWTDEQAKLAFDLLYTPQVFRTGRKPGDSIDFEGQLVADGSDPAAVARREIAALKERREIAADLDEVERTLASNDMTNEGDPELRRLRRYESMLHNKMKWYLKQITIQSPYRVADPSLRPTWSAEPLPAVQPEPEPEPNTDDIVYAPKSKLPSLDLMLEEIPKHVPGPEILPNVPVYKSREDRMQEARDAIYRKKRRS